MIDRYKNARSASLPIALGLVLAATALTVSAKPKYAKEFKVEYGYSPSCLGCHSEGGGTPVNSYGQAYMDNGQNSAAYAAIAALDSDGDGINNETEINAKANPGDKASVPGNIGNWMDLLSLIPKEVQALFPKATAWKPLDAILTDKDIQAAAKLGATLSKDDENTIYIPVAERRPIGTGLIFPASYGDQTFFLLMTTDRKLTISHIQVLNADDYQEAAASKSLTSLIGSPLNGIAADTSDTLDNNIAKAVKRAGALVYVRLKGA